MAERDLLQAISRDDVLRAFFDFALQYFEYSALFAVHGDLAEGRDANGPGADRARVNGIGVPLDLPSALAAARQEGKWQLLRLSGDGIDAALAKDLERQAGRTVLLLPVMVRERCVLILYGDHGSNDVELGSIGELLAFAPLVSVSLERVIVKRKLMARGEEGAPIRPNAFAERANRSRAPKPDLKDRAMALARALDLSRVSSAPPPPTAVPVRPATTPSTAPAPITQPIPEQPKTAPDPHVTASPPARQRASTERLQRPRTQPLLSPPPKPSQISRPTDAEAEATASALRRAVVPVGDGGAASRSSGEIAPAHPVISVGGEPRRSTPAQGTPIAIGAQTSDETAPIPLTRRSSPASPAVAGAEEPPWQPVSAPTSAKPISRKQTLVGGSERLKDESAPGDSAPEIAIGTATLDADIDELLRASEGAVQPSSRSIVHHSHRLRPRRSSDEMRLPTVIVDLASDCRELVRRLLSGDNEAAEKLVEIGAPAVSELVAAFPGPITRELRRGAGDGPPRASECGPLLRTLARIGPDAAPFLIVRTADTDPKVRAWATRLLGELPTIEGARAVAKRLADTDTDVRRAALAAGRMMQADPETRGALREDLSEAAAATGQPSEVRQAALEAMSDLRDPRSVARLIRLLNEKDAVIGKSAHWALVTITRQDFGRDAVRWTAWWEQNANNHRIEWLIDSLMHEDAEIRRAAGDELKALTKEYFGYYDDLPRKERQRAQSRYREWWETKGKARFSKQSM
jgi:HEAT repeat protein